MKEIPLTGKYGAGKVALVDDENFDWLNQFKWHVNNGYVRTRDGYSHVKMHSLILKPKRGFLPDHKDGNKLNNQKDNLRYCKSFQNCQNRTKREGVTSKYKGVSLLKYPNSNTTWQAHIMVKSKAIGLGHFNSEEDAALAYNEAAKKHHGEFAKLNIL